jgi:hypothetical protein
LKVRGEQAFPRAEEVALLAEEKLKQNPEGEISSAVPLYLSTYQRLKTPEKYFRRDGKRK